MPHGVHDTALSHTIFFAIFARSISARSDAVQAERAEG
jgi:hypothetical protein